MTKIIKPEIVIEREILVYLNSLPHAFFWKNDTFGAYDEDLKAYRKSPNPYVLRGVSDIIGIIQGVVFLFEVKNARGVESKHQKGFRNKFNKLGGNCFVVRSVDETREILEEYEIIPPNLIST